MGHAFYLTDREYRDLARVAVDLGATPEDLFRDWLEDVLRPPKALEAEGWFRHLGATEEDIREARRIVEGRNRGKVR